MNPIERLKYDRHFEISHPQALTPRKAKANGNADYQAIEEKIAKLLSDGFCASDIARFLNLSIERINKVELDESTTSRKVSSLTTATLVWGKEN